jgi:hypothetical protein
MLFRLSQDTTLLTLCYLGSHRIQRYLHYHPTPDELLEQLTCKEKKSLQYFLRIFLLKGKDKDVSALI